MLFLALAGITAVCLVFAELRLLAVVGLAVELHRKLTRDLH